MNNFHIYRDGHRDTIANLLLKARLLSDKLEDQAVQSWNELNYYFEHH